MEGFDLHEMESELRRRNAKIEAAAAKAVREADRVAQPPAAGPAPLATHEEIEAEDRLAAERRKEEARKRAREAAEAERGAQRDEGEERERITASERAELKVLRARVEQLEQTAKALHAQGVESQTQLRQARAETRALEEDNARMAKRAAQHKAQAARHKAEMEEAETRGRELAHRLEAARGEARTLEKEGRKQETEAQTRAARLNRALQEVERYKEMLKQQQQSRRANTDSSRSETRRLEGEVRRVTQQRDELLAAFRKQMRLIDVLKRQKMHLEASKMLSFTEDEFSRVLDLGAE